MAIQTVLQIYMFLLCITIHNKKGFLHYLKKPLFKVKNKLSVLLIENFLFMQYTSLFRVAYNIYLLRGMKKSPKCQTSAAVFTFDFNERIGRVESG